MESPCAGRTIISTKRHWNTSISPDICLSYTPWQGVIRHHIGVALERPHALKVLMGGHHLIELDQHGADEEKLTSKAPSLLPVTDPQFKEI